MRIQICMPADRPHPSCILTRYSYEWFTTVLARTLDVMASLIQVWAGVNNSLGMATENDFPAEKPPATDDVLAKEENDLAQALSAYAEPEKIQKRDEIKRLQESDWYFNYLMRSDWAAIAAILSV